MPIGRQEWMRRSHADYDPNRIGEISQARVLAALIEAGKFVYLPIGQAGRSDLVFEDERGLFRVQSKTGGIFNGAMFFPTQSLRAAHRETEWKRVARDYQGDIDYFGVYCTDNGKVYLVPIAVAATHWRCFLRLDPPKNKQRKGIRWAREFELPVSPEPDLFSTI